MLPLDDPARRKEFIDVSLAVYREDMTDARHAQQLFQSTLTIFGVIISVMVSQKPAISQFLGSSSVIYVCLINIPYFVTVYAIRHAIVCHNSETNAALRCEALAEITGIEVDLKSASKRNSVAKDSFWFGLVRSSGSKIAIIAIMIVVDIMTFSYLLK